MNEYDSNRILDLVKNINYEKTFNISEADCFVLNTCHIREKATSKVYHEIGRVKKRFLKRKKPITIVAGCVAQAEGEILLKKEKYIDAVLGTQSYHKINEIIVGAEKKNKKINSTEFDVIQKFDELNIIKNFNSKTSSYLTIQEGCDKFCKFCVVPYTRGPEYSRSKNEILAEAKQLVENGSKEIILLGQNVNAYKYNNSRLSNLLYDLNEIKGLERIRYTTSHPRDFTDDLIEAHKNLDKLMPLIHLPVQSGSSKVLKNMNRKHNIEFYLKIIGKLLEKNSSIKFSSDFIIGYPGENENDFKKTMSLLKKIKFINSYSFIFNPRPGTPASKLKIVDPEIAKNRLIVFQKMADEIKMNYKNKLVGSVANVLFENRVNNENRFFGRDEYYNSVIVNSEENLVGKTKKVKISECSKNSLFGKLVLSMQQKEYAA